jgi:FixJ family two-component response regulator
MRSDELVHIIDCDAPLRSAVTGLLCSVGIAALSYDSTQAFRDSLQPDVPSCLLLDVRLPGQGGLAFQAQMPTLGLRLPVVMMTAHADVPMAVKAMKAGAVDFLGKPFRDQDLLDAVVEAISRDRRRRAEHVIQTELARRYASLSVRERQVMSMIADGALNKQVAFNLGLSEITIKVHRASAMRKLEARSLADLVKISERLRVA